MTEPANTTNNRLQVLEERVAHQDAQIEELSTSIFEQWKVIDILKARLTAQVQQIEALGDDLRRTGGDQPPPHY